MIHRKPKPHQYNSLLRTHPCPTSHWCVCKIRCCCLFPVFPPNVFENKEDFNVLLTQTELKSQCRKISEHKHWIWFRISRISRYRCFVAQNQVVSDKMGFLLLTSSWEMWITSNRDLWPLGPLDLCLGVRPRGSNLSFRHNNTRMHSLFTGNWSESDTNTTSVSLQLQHFYCTVIQKTSITSTAARQSLSSLFSGMKQPADPAQTGFSWFLPLIHAVRCIKLVQLEVQSSVLVPFLFNH